MKKNHLHLLLFVRLLFWICPILGQAQKTVLPPQDYALWGKLVNREIASHGNYVSFELLYGANKDTLFVRNTKGKPVLAVANGYNGTFLNNSFFGCYTDSSGYQISNLKTGIKQKFSSIYYSRSLNKGAHLVLQTIPENERSTLIFLRYDGTVVQSITDVVDLKVSPDQRSVLFCQKRDTLYQLIKANLSAEKITLKEIHTGLHPFYNFVWQKNNASIAYVEEATETKEVTLHSYNLTTKTARQIDLSQDTVFNNYSFKHLRNTQLKISEDGKRLFFPIKIKPLPQQVAEAKVVEVWNTADKQVRLYRQKYERNPSHLGLWKMDSGKSAVIEGNQDKVYQLNANQQFAVTGNSNKYLPTTQAKAATDYKIVDLQKGTATLFLENQIGANQELYFSPNGAVVVYVRKGLWWSYTFATQQSTLLAGLSKQFLTTDGVNLDLFPHGVAGWDKEDGSFFLYDAYDLWEYNLSTATLVRLTKGKEKGITYRLTAQDKNRTLDQIAYAKNTPLIDRTKGNLLSMSFDNDRKTGFALLSKKGVTTLVFEEKKYSQPVYYAESNQLTYLREDFDLPPQLMVWDTKKGKQQLIVQSNAQHFLYQWGTSERIHYQNKKGEAIQGALFYPFNFQKEKKYPMVVQIYENFSDQIHSYVYPSFYNTNGFNTANLTGGGYFVLRPDIVYEIGNPGRSALDCVESAVAAVLKKSVVNPNKIGLIGHSFGGYQTYFITALSKTFATGIAGAGISDIKEMYLSLGIDTAQPEVWRFEHQQLRMGKSVFENPEDYVKNNPLTYAVEAAVPLLAWTGTQDNTVSSEQTMRWHMAMRRLQKPHLMLRYPKQGHVLFDPVQQQDLTIKVQQWLDYYLQDKKQQPWMEAK
ncbi:prolyl oligopeptidase family serine peptidase [Flavobacterium sp. SM2513]|uniref:alpha/beta hydrolase family protein n=1 Tax=Flavobacterium sp. SM2513 TaxID=3424766 RepID=UPI003D7F55C0